MFLDRQIYPTPWGWPRKAQSSVDISLGLRGGSWVWSWRDDGDVAYLAGDVPVLFSAAAKTLRLLDGGMGRELQRTGAPFRQPEWSALALIEAPEFVL